ncbi:MAG: polyphosphate kinase 2 family protein [Anaerolineaceae bacterium]|nr:polyphosphate kinase 2 family protein [Anaerolineaceae bacterium]
MRDYRVPAKGNIKLTDFDPDDTGKFDGGKKEGKVQLRKLNLELEVLQELLYAENKHKLLIILQGMDTSGKDGVIRHVFEGVNPQGVQVASFKVPTSVELAHDYLWRVHQKTPGKGEIVIFNRSHYEDVLVVRVHNIVPKEVWKKRFEQINAFERLLAEEGTTILKFYLHIDLQEQAQRLLERVETPEKHWKFNPGDLDERQYWQDYQAAYEDVLNKTSTDFAPWLIVPSNKKWYRNLVIANVIVDKLKSLRMSYPADIEDLEVHHKRLLEMTLSKE